MEILGLDDLQRFANGSRQAVCLEVRSLAGDFAGQDCAMEINSS
jgi:hypothetical protein